MRTEKIIRFFDNNYRFIVRLLILIIFLVVGYKTYLYGGWIYLIVYSMIIAVFYIFSTYYLNNYKAKFEIILLSLFGILFTIFQLSQVEVQNKLAETQTRIASGSAVVDLIDKLLNYKIEDYSITPIETGNITIFGNTINLHKQNYISFKLKYISSSNVKFNLCDDNITKKVLLMCKLVTNNSFEVVSCKRNNSDTLTYVINVKSILDKTNLSLSLDCNLNYKDSLSKEQKKIVDNFLFVPIKKTNFIIDSNHIYQNKKFFLIDFSGKKRKNNLEVKKVRQIIENNGGVLKTAPVLLKNKPFNNFFCDIKNNCFIILYKNTENNEVCNLLKYDIEKLIPVLSGKVFNTNGLKGKEFIEYTFTNLLKNWDDLNKTEIKKYLPSLYMDSWDKIGTYGEKFFIPNFKDGKYENFENIVHEVNCIIFWPKF